MPRTQGPAALARELDPAQTQVIRITLNAKQVEIVNRLYKTGLWGNSPAETSRRVFDQGCMGHVEKRDTVGGTVNSPFLRD